MNKKILIILALLAIGVAVSAMVQNGKSEDADRGQQVPDSSSGTMLAGSNAIYVKEQKIGSEAFISFVVLEKPGYVVVHEIAEGKPGKILGMSALLPQGQSKNVTVTLTDALVDGASYAAMPHLDNGDSVFDEVSDTPAKNNSDTVMMEFRASTNPQDQPDGEISM
jgi:hypothetical protein